MSPWFYEILHHSIFKRMIGDYDQATTWRATECCELKLLKHPFLYLFQCATPENRAPDICFPTVWEPHGAIASLNCAIVFIGVDSLATGPIDGPTPALSNFAIFLKMVRSQSSWNRAIYNIGYAVFTEFRFIRISDHRQNGKKIRVRQHQNRATKRRSAKYRPPVSTRKASKIADIFKIAE